MADPIRRDLDRETPRLLEVQERNAFYESLSAHARQRFLDALEEATRAGLGEEEAWRAAVVAAEEAYPREELGQPLVETPPPPLNPDSAQE